jgi:putative transcriptional regulator
VIRVPPSPSTPSPSTPSPSTRGRLLVATPSLTDPNFARTVILVLEHGDDGALGVVLNRPTDAELDRAVPGWSSVAAPPAVVYVGGPVAAGAAIALASGRGTGPGGGFTALFGGIGTVDLGREEEREHVDRIRVFAGYAGWAPGQLEAEIGEGSWFVVAASPLEDAFCRAPEHLWSGVLRRQGGRLSWFANFPVNASSN